MMTIAIEALTDPALGSDLDALAALLVDAVDANAAVSFLQPLSLDQARAYWQNAIQALSPRSRMLVCRDDQAHIIACVMLHAAWAPNQPHRGEISKVLVHRAHRNRGLATALMQAAESAAHGLGMRLLTLDARAGGPAEALYRKLDWVCIGYIPKFALDADGQQWHDDVLFYKTLPG